MEWNKVSKNMIDDEFTVQVDEIERATSKIYGVYWDKLSNPSMTRTDDAIDMIANVGTGNEIVLNDFDSAQIYREMHEVVDLYMNRFIRIPKFYIYKESGENHLIKKVSRYKHKGFYLPHVFWDFKKGKELPYFDYGIHNASLDTSNKLESKPERYPLVSRNIVQFREYARNNNTEENKGYQQLDVHAYDVLLTLFYVEFATLDSQTIMRGFTTGRYTATDLAKVAEENTNRVVLDKTVASQFRIGQSIGIGTSQGGNQITPYRTILDIVEYDVDKSSVVFDGNPLNIAVGNMVYTVGWKTGFDKDISSSSGSIVNNTDGKYPCMYRGIENPFGNIWQFVDGINITVNQTWVAKDAEKYASNVFANPYEKVGYINSNINGYVKEMGYDSSHPSVELPSITEGASPTTFYSDYYYQAAGTYIARVGGRWSDGSNAGLSSWSLSTSAASASVYIGGRLLKKAL